MTANFREWRHFLRLRLGKGAHPQVIEAAHARGLGACAIGALASYPGVVRQALGLPADHLVVCGMALGYEDMAAPVNATRTQRAALKEYFSVLGT